MRYYHLYKFRRDLVAIRARSGAGHAEAERRILKAFVSIRARSRATVDSDDPWFYTCYNQKWQAVTLLPRQRFGKERYIYPETTTRAIGPFDVRRQDLSQWAAEYIVESVKEMQARPQVAATLQRARCRLLRRPPFVPAQHSGLERL